jgi:hypothetical protein
MRLTRLLGLVFVAVVAMSCAVVSSAGAFSSNPLFSKGSVGATITLGSGSASVLTESGLVIGCKENHVVSGTVSNELLIGDAVIRYLGCEYTKGEVESGCPANSTGATGGLISLTTLHAILGLLLPQNTTGILFLPVASKVFTTFAAAEKGGKKCAPEGQLAGNVAAEVEPVGVAGGSVNATIKVISKEIQDIDLTHGLGLVKAKVTFFGEGSAFTQTDEVMFNKAVEVT